MCGCRNDRAGEAGPAASAPVPPLVAQPRPGATDLQTYLQTLATDPTVTSSADLVSRLQASPATWDATIIKPFTGCRASSERALAVASTLLWTSLRTTPPPTISVRKHYAGDAGLPPGAAHLRWALPVLFDSYVVALNDTTLDLVFWPTQLAAGWRWSAMGNIDADLAQAITLGKTDDVAMTRCAAQVVASHHNERCLQLAAAVVLAALHSDRNATAHVCALAAVHCTEGR